MFGIASFAQVAFSSLASGVVLGTASITADATVTASAIRTQFGQGVITARRRACHRLM